ncbi:MAG TPA: acyltransferase family protein [Gemmatimonadaceae bacterium]|nr:acyltransferase family protein [Gemmatimonadaceae bacterium]
MSTPPPLPTRRLDVDGLRGLAVLLVVGFHAGVVWLQGAFVAVDVFFVLSGFFLTTTLARHLVTDDGIDLGAVYARRAWRLLPAMIVVVLATLASALLLYAPIDRAAVAEHMRPVSFFASNIAFAAGGVNYFSAAENPLLHTWTLGVEWQLVLIFPALVVMLVALGHRRAGADTGQTRRLMVMRTVFGGIFVAGVISFVISVWISASSPMWAYFGPHTRLWAFCAGALMAFIAGGGQSIFGGSVRRTSIAQLIGFAAIFIPAFLYDRSMPYPGAIALAPVGGTMLLLAGGDVASETPFGRLLASRPLAWIGSVSYPWYLWHWPLMVLGAALVPGIGVLGRVAWGVVGLLFAVVTRRYIEGPVHERIVPRVMAGRPLLTAAAASLSLVVTAQFAAMWSNNRVAHSVHRAFAEAREDRMDHSCWVGEGNVSPANKCAFGDKQSSTAIALLGDSHAEHWLGGLERAGKEHGWRIEANVMGGCPVSDFSALISGATARRYRGCNQFREATLARLVAQKPRAVILSSFDYYMQTDEAAGVGFQVADNVWIEGLRRTYARLARAGIQVIVIRGTPRVPFDVPSCLSRRAAGLPFATNCSFDVDRAFIARGRRAQDAAARGLDVDFIDMNDLVCASAQCETMRGRQIVFTDNNHLTASFTRSLGAELGERLEAALARRQ